MGLENGPAEAGLSWLPPGAIGQGMIAVRGGQWGSALTHLLVAVAGIGVALAAWTWGIRRRVRGSSGRTASAGPRRASTESALIPVPLSVMRPSPSVASASQQARYYFFRSPRAVQTAALPAVMGIVLGHTVVADGGLVLAAVFFVLLALLSSSFNVFGFDDTGFAFLLSIGAPWRRILVGKSLVGLLSVSPILAGLVIVEAAVNDLWNDAAAAFVTGIAVGLVVIGVGAVVSVRNPLNHVNPAGANRSRTLIGTLTGIAAVVLIGGSIGFGLPVLGDTLDQTVLALISVAIAGAIAWALLRYAATRLAADPWRVQQRLHV